MIRNIDRDFPKTTERILVDANVLLFLACPLGGYEKKKIMAYSRFLNSVRKSKIKLYFTSLILSEFSNRWLRLEFESYRNVNPHVTPKDFKSSFRVSHEYQAALRDIYHAIRFQVLAFAQPIDDHFEKLNIDDFFHPGLDINDGHSVELAKLEGLSILTDDADFAVARKSVDVWTWNRRMIALK